MFLCFYPFRCIHFCIHYMPSIETMIHRNCVFYISIDSKMTLKCVFVVGNYGKCIVRYIHDIDATPKGK